MMQEFSIAQISMQRMVADRDQRLSSVPAPPWQERDMQPDRVARRILQSQQDFWKFDTFYFTADIYDEHYATPAFHRLMIKQASAPGVITFLAARDHGKTALFKRWLLWRVLNSTDVDIAGLYCETLPKAQNMLSDISELLKSNPRLVHDYRPSIIVDNADTLEFATAVITTKRTIATFSEGRSVRGYTKNFSRPKLIIADDVETLQSSFTPDAVRDRIRRIAETHQSLNKDGTLVVLGNNFEERGAFNTLLKEKAKGILPTTYNIHVYPAWIKGKPLWRAKFPAQTETELKQMVGALDESDWQGNYQQNPIPPDGEMFVRAGYAEYDSLPQDAKLGALYTDPNCALKAKGDTTASPAVVYSPSEDAFYVLDMICRSYSDPNKLLDDVGSMFRAHRGVLVSLGFDGNVSQESTWTAHVRNYQRITGTVFHRVEFKRYKIDVISKNTVMLWQAGKIRFPRGFAQTPDGMRALQQIFSFTGKKSSRKDDAPDALCGVIELMHERRLVRRASSSRPISTTRTRRL